MHPYAIMARLSQQSQPQAFKVHKPGHYGKHFFHDGGAYATNLTKR